MVVFKTIREFKAFILTTVKASQCYQQNQKVGARVVNLLRHPLFTLWIIYFHVFVRLLTFIETVVILVVILIVIVTVTVTVILILILILILCVSKILEDNKRTRIIFVYFVCSISLDSFFCLFQLTAVAWYGTARHWLDPAAIAGIIQHGPAYRSRNLGWLRSQQSSNFKSNCVAFR